MWVNVLEVGLFVLVGLVLLAPILRDAVRKARNGPAAPRDEVRRRWAGRIGGTLFAVAVMNFLAFSVHTQSLGGSAGNGRRADGHYFVGSHGRYTEVTEPQWRTVRTHEVTVFVTHALGLLVGAPLLVYWQRRSDRQTPAEVTA